MKYVNGIKDYRNNQGFWVRSETADGVKYLTNAGQLWNNVEARCNPLSAECARYPSYIGTQNHFKDFQQFAEWCQGSKGYQELDSSGNKYHLDKDLLFVIGESAERSYSVNSIFMPPRINQMLKFDVGDSDLPIGVADYDGYRYRMQYRDIHGKKTHGGIFDTQLEAHEAWLIEQVDIFSILATQQWQGGYSELGSRLGHLASVMRNHYDRSKEFKVD